MHVIGEAFEHRADFGLTLGRESKAALQSLRGYRDQPFFNDVAGMFEIGGKGKNFRQPAIVVIVERVRLELGQVALDRPFNRSSTSSSAFVSVTRLRSPRARPRSATPSLVTHPATFSQSRLPRRRLPYG